MGVKKKVCYVFCSEKVNEVKSGCAFFNTHIKPMFPWFQVDVVAIYEVMGWVTIRVSGVSVDFSRGDGDGWIALIPVSDPESAEVWDQQRNYIERFCCVIDGYRRNDAGELEKIAG